MSKKHYIITAVTLGIVAATSGLLIGLTNLATVKKIDENKQLKIKDGISEIYSNSDLKYTEISFSGEYEYVKKAYKVNQSNDEPLGYAFQTSGSNVYGKVELIVGFVNGSGVPFVFKGISVITNEQTYNTTLEDEYIVPLNEDQTKIDDVKCGATYGAKLVRAMIEDSTKAAEEVCGA